MFQHTANENYKIQWSTYSDVWMVDYVPGRAPFKISGRSDGDLPVDGTWEYYEGERYTPPKMQVVGGGASSEAWDLHVTKMTSLDLDLAPGVYVFRVRARNRSGYSAWSEASAEHAVGSKVEVEA